MPEENAVTEENVEAIRSEIANEEFEESTVSVAEPSKTEEDPAVEAVVEEDPWAGVNPTLRKTFDDMTAKVASMSVMEQRLKQTESRIGAMQNKLSAAEKAAQAAPPAPTKEEIEVAAKEKESWETLKEDFPEWAEVVETRFAKTKTDFEERQKALEQSQLLSSRVINQKIIDLTDTMEKTREKTMLTFKHPDWESTIQSPEYATWLKTQTPEVQQKTSSKFAKDAISVLDEFSKIKKPEKTPAEIAADRKKRLEGSVTVPGKKAMPVKAEADMNDEELRDKVAEEVWAD